ncbi:MAG: TRAP transporter TatT component family protein [Candidatus Methylomirabilales bacterium]
MQTRRTKKAGAHHRSERRPEISLILVAAALLLAACSVKKTAANIIGDTLAGSGGVYASDDDPELVREAIPFGLKTYESLLEVSPEHEGILLASASGFTAYAYMLQDDADRLDVTDLPQARQMRARVRKLYLRGRDFALRGLEVEHPRFTAVLETDRNSALAMTTEDDVPFLYWAGASWAGALSVAKDDLDLIAELPTAGALVGRVLELDETYDLGAAHEFFISYEGSRPGGSTERAREHYRRALEISDGQRASVHLALAESVTIQEQNLAEFKALIAAALAVDPDKEPNLRLANIIAQRRALWLQKRIPDLFLEAEETEEAQ